jgi:hypothetical protein
MANNENKKAGVTMAVNLFIKALESDMYPS